MRQKLPLAAMAGVATLLAGAAIAQQTGTSTGITATQGTSQGAEVTRTGLEKTHDGWRTSQIIGGTVYSDKNQSIGTINDLITGSDGKISQAIISVGGFLGIGSKLVAVPFDQLHFDESTQTDNTAGTGGAGTGLAAPATTGTGATPDTTPTQPPAAATAGTTGTATPSTTAATTTAAPGPMVKVVRTRIVLPGATVDSLKGMSEFKY